jgi:hypothetical protein
MLRFARPPARAPQFRVSGLTRINYVVTAIIYIIFLKKKYKIERPIQNQSLFYIPMSWMKALPFSHIFFAGSASGCM